MQTNGRPPNSLSLRVKVFNIIKERSFARGRFILVSGRESPFYLDLKTTMLHPEGARILADLILQRLEGVQVDYIGGIAVGAVPLVTAVNVVSHMKSRPIPGFFVRKQVKDHGTRKRIEAAGDIRGKRVVVLDDVTTTGSSAMEAVTAVQEDGAIFHSFCPLSTAKRGLLHFTRKRGCRLTRYSVSVSSWTRQTSGCGSFVAGDRDRSWRQFWQSREVVPPRFEQSRLDYLVERQPEPNASCHVAGKECVSEWGHG